MVRKKMKGPTHAKQKDQRKCVKDNRGDTHLGSKGFGDEKVAYE